MKGRRGRTWLPYCCKRADISCSSVEIIYLTNKGGEDQNYFYKSLMYSNRICVHRGITMSTNHPSSKLD